MSRLIQAITNKQIKKKYNTNNIYQMDHLLTDANTFIKPAISAASILAVKYSVTGNFNFHPSDYALAGGIGAGFLVAKIAKPYLQNYEPEWMASRGTEIVAAGAVLYALNAAKLIQLDFSKQNIAGLGVLFGTILIADVLGEGILPFIAGHSV